jgi:RNA polymerase sigma factor for flagellar operon FliA
VLTTSTSDKRLSAVEAERLWRAWRERGDAASRDRLVLSYAPMVKYLASRKARAVPTHCELDDLVSCGLMALIAAVDRFDPVKGATFEQYAWTRVSGAIMDELRRLDWAPRSVRRNERHVSEARDRLHVKAGRPPSEDELANELKISILELRDRLAEAERADVRSLNAHIRTGEEIPSEVGETIEAPPSDLEPEHSILVRERTHVLRSAIANLPDREREVLTLVHVHRLGGAEIGRMLGVSESRVSQILASARDRLRSAIENYDRPVGEAA